MSRFAELVTADKANVTAKKVTFLVAAYTEITWVNNKEK
ncbi:hypothetical protein AKN40_2764 [Escherichia coli]|nr:hypothetical protein AKN40_2764 [Escherichia coli]